jgi:hypothetical protein
MNLPNYFLADLPADASPSAQMIAEACVTLKRNRERYLAPRSTGSLVELLSEVARTWRDPHCPFLQMALNQGPAVTGFQVETLRKGLDRFFGRLTADGLQALLLQDLGHPQRLDRISASSGPDAGRAAVVSGPELLVHITAGNIPAPALMSMVLGVLLRSAQFVKCASEASLLPRLFAHSLYQADPKLGACLEIACWPGGSTALEDPLFEAADCVTATGTDETLATIQQRLPRKTRFVAYGNRFSFAYITKEMLSGFTAKKMIERATDDVVAWNQLGCLSPHAIYVEDGGVISPEAFAELLAEAMGAREQTEPRGPLSRENAAAIASRRSIYELRAAHTAGTRLWCSPDSTAWTVVYEAEPRFQLSCLNRFIYVKGVNDLTTALQGAHGFPGKVSTVGLGAPEHKVEALATELARWGVTRVCPVGKMQDPPLTWRHDGRPPLGELVTWTDWEME